MKFKSILSRSGQGLLNARATNIANIVKGRTRTSNCHLQKE